MTVNIIVIALIVSILLTEICESYKLHYIKNYNHNTINNNIIKFQGIRNQNNNDIILSNSKNEVGFNDDIYDDLADGYDDYDDFIHSYISNFKILLLNLSKKLIVILTSIIMILLNTNMISICYAKDNNINVIPSLEKCFNAVEKELSNDGESLRRINQDIAVEDWNDLKLFTREYDAGFRGGVLKVAWKQLKGMMMIIMMLMKMMVMEMMMIMIVMIIMMISMIMIII